MQFIIFPPDKALRFNLLALTLMLSMASTGDEGGGNMTEPFFSHTPFYFSQMGIYFLTIGCILYHGDRRLIE